MWFELGFNQGHDDDNLVHIGDQHMFTTPRSPRQQTVPRLNPFDEPLIVQRGAKPDAIAGGHDVPLIRDQRAQESADGTAIKSAVVGLHHAGETVNAQDAAWQASAAIHGRHDAGLLACLVRGFGFVLNDGPPPRQLALGANPFLARQGGFFKAMLLETARPVLRPGWLGTILTQLDTDLLFFAHKRYAFCPSYL
jgi:hypothetical protein